MDAPDSHSPTTASPRARLGAQRGIWLAAGTMGAWAVVALPSPWSVAGPLGILIAFAIAPGWGARAAVGLGVVVQSLLQTFLWTPWIPPAAWEGELPAVVVEDVSRGGRLVVRIPSFPETPAGWSDALVLAPRDRPLNAVPGDTLRGRFRLRPLSPPTAPGGFDGERWGVGQGLSGWLSWKESEPPQVLAGTTGEMAQLRIALRNRIAQGFSQDLDPDAARLWTSALLGDTRVLPESWIEAFRNTGQVHLLAVSGSHLAMVAFVTGLALRLLQLPRPVCLIGALILAGFYGWLVAGSAAVLRALAAFAVATAALLHGRRPQGAHALGMAVAVLVWVDPNAPFDTGWQLSVAATFGILFLQNGLAGWIPARTSWLPGLLSELPVLARIAIATFAATAPILAATFQTVPWAGPLAGFALPLLFGVGFAAAFLSGTAHLVGVPVLAIPWNGASEGVARLVLEAVARLDSAAPPPFQLGAPSWIGLALFTAALGAAAWASLSQRRALPRAIALGLVALATLPGVWTSARSASLTVLDVGQGLAVLAQASDGRAVLLDAGGAWPGGDAGQRTVLPVLRHAGIHRLEFLILTHGDLDHAGGAPSVLDGVEVIRLGIPDPSPAGGHPNLLLRIADTVQTRGIAIYRLSAGDTIELGDLRLRVLAPAPPRVPANTNTGSMVVHVEGPGWSVLVAGDADTLSESLQVASNLDLRADILVAGHHGSATSTGARYLDAVRPEGAVISRGAWNRYGHPAPRVMAELRVRAIRIHDTAVKGSAIVRRSGDSLEFAPAFRRFWRGPWVSIRPI